MTVRVPHNFAQVRRAAIRGMCAIAMVLFAWLASARAEGVAPKEYQVKAAFLLNFAQFIQWPANAFDSPDAPIRVGVLGDDPFGKVLEQTFEDEVVDGRKLVIKRSRNIGDLKNCQMIFVSKSEKDHLRDIFKAVHDLGIVTVGETDGFAQSGGIINFTMEAGKIRFEINAGAAQRKGLKISSQLLKRATLVTTDAGKE